LDSFLSGGPLAGKYPIEKPLAIYLKARQAGVETLDQTP
jgi:hypothetical protein